MRHAAESDGFEEPAARVVVRGDAGDQRMALRRAAFGDEPLDEPPADAESRTVGGDIDGHLLRVPVGCAFLPVVGIAESDDRSLPFADEAGGCALQPRPHLFGTERFGLETGRAVQHVVIVECCHGCGVFGFRGADCHAAECCPGRDQSKNPSSSSVYCDCCISSSQSYSVTRSGRRNRSCLEMPSAGFL